MTANRHRRRVPIKEVGLNTFNVVLKVSERCNLACPYCYFFFSGDETYKEHPPIVPKAVVKNLASFLRQAVADYGFQAVRIGFHGGEPLLMKKAAFAALCETLSAELDPVCSLMLGVQTNGVLLDDEWIDLFVEHGVRVGVSFDGAKAQHDKTRITKKGKGTYDETARGWRLLTDAAKAGRMPYPGMLCVVDPEQDGAQVFRDLVADLHSLGVNFLLPDYTHDSPELTQEHVDRCGDFMSGVFKAWLQLKRPEIRLRFVTEVMGPLLDDEAARRNLISKNNPRGLITISSNGDIAPDDTLRGIGDEFRSTGLNVRSATLSDVLEHPLWKMLIDAHDTPGPICEACEWWNACKGGLQMHRYSSKNGMRNPSIYCDALKNFHNEVATILARGGYSKDGMSRRMSKAFAVAARQELEVA